MKISISKTELNAMPHVAWNKFCDFVLDNQENEEQYTSVQKNAATCFWYHAEVCGEGHDGYFNNWENVDNDELAQALCAIGAPEFADNLIEAVKYGLEDDYIMTDKWFGENEEALFKAIEKYLRDNVSEFYEIIEEDYTMRQSIIFYRLGIIGAVMFFAFMVIFLIVGTEDARMAAVGFAAFCLSSALYALYAKMWRVTVKSDTFTVHTPFRQPREYRLNEISEVRHTLQGLVVFVYDRKTFATDNSVSNFDIFHAQIREAGKMETMQYRNGFTIRPHNGNMLIGLIAILFFVAVFIWIVLWPDETVEVIKHMITSAFTLIPLCLASRSLLWRLTVSDDTITVKKVLVREKEYKIRDITEVYEGANIAVYVRDKEIFRISRDCIDAPLLIERLVNKGIPFYEKRSAY